MVEIIDEPTVTFRVLVVDDDADVGALLRASIDRAQGLEVCGTATTPEAALQLARATEPDVIVLDYDLGAAMTGLDLAVRLREVVPNANIVMCSAFVQDGDAFDGVDAVYRKDRASELTAALRQMVGLAAATVGPTMPCANPACRTHIPLADVDIREQTRTVTCAACGATRSWSVPA